MDKQEFWAALEAHEPKPEYAAAWRRMCKERTAEAVAAAWADTPAGSTVEQALEFAERAVINWSESERLYSKACDSAQAAIKELGWA